MKKKTNVIEFVDKRPDRSKPLPQYLPLRPIQDRIMLKRVIEDTAPDGFHVEEKYREQTNKGLVLHVGELVVGILPGDLVLFGEYNAEKFELDNEETTIVRYGDIRAVSSLVRKKAPNA